MVTDTVIFDFDDTLVATNCLFNNARNRFFEVMATQGCTDKASIKNYLEEADIRNVISCGYMAKDCFPHALRETYQHFAQTYCLEEDASLAASIENIGWDVYEQEVDCLEGAQEILAALQGKVNLYLFTQGDKQMQVKRLERSNLLPFFDDYRIVRKKDAEAYALLINDKKIIPERSWMIGNSIKSDVNPAISVGLQAAHYKISAWDFEHEEPIGDYYTIERLIDFLELIKL